MGDDVAEDFDRDVMFADGFDWYGELYLALVNFEALRSKTFGDVACSDRSEHLIVVAGLALEVERNAREQFRLLLCGFEFGGRFFREGSANAFERIHVPCCRFNREAARQ